MKKICIALIVFLIAAPLIFGIGGREVDEEETKPAAEAEAASAQDVFATPQEYEAAFGKKITKFNQAPALAEMVSKGQLPSIEKRLPKEPLIVQPVEEIGQYGGTWEQFITSAGLTQLQSIYAYETVVRWDRDCSEIIPNVAKKWDVSEDGKLYTFYLREGMRWSDGQPFSADDVMFWYNDLEMNREVSPAPSGWMIETGDIGNIVKIDDYTIQFVFNKPSAFMLENLAKGVRPWACAHFLKQFHPDYVDKATLDKQAKDAGFEGWFQLLDAKRDVWDVGNVPDYPSIRAWYPTAEHGAEIRYIFERNPYYWKIDTAGNQLPYIDRMAFNVVEGMEMAAFKAMSGEATLQGWGLAVKDYTLFKDNEDTGDYRVLLWPTETGANVAFYVNQTCNDPEISQYLTNDKFRKALSLAINREEINELVFLGLGTPRQAAPTSGSIFYKDAYGTAWADFDPERANQMLDEIGLSKKDSSGFRLMPNGKRLEILVEHTTQREEYADTCELVQEYWQNVGVKTNLKAQQVSVFRDRIFTGETQIGIWNFGQADYPFAPVFIAPHTKYTYWASKYGQWYESGGEIGIEPTDPDILELQDIFEKVQYAITAEEKERLFTRYYELHQKNCWVIGTVGETPQLIVAKNDLRNIPQKALWDWIIGRYFGHTQIEQFFLRQ